MQSGEISAHGLLHPDRFPAGRTVGWTPAGNAAAVADAIHRSGESVLAEERPVRGIPDEIESFDSQFGAEAKTVLQRSIGTEQLPRGAMLDAGRRERGLTTARGSLSVKDAHRRNNGD